MSDTYHIGQTSVHNDVKITLSDETKEGLPVYEISEDDFMKMLSNAEIVENIGD